MADQPQTPDVDGTVFEPGVAEIARSYAQALLNLAEEGDRGEALLSELEEIARDLWTGQPEFAALIGGSFLPADRRDALIGELLEGRADDLLVRFLRVINRRGRLGLVPEIAAEARRVWNQRQRIVTVTVRSAVPLAEDQVEAIRQRMEAVLPGRRTVVQATIDPDILAGLIVQVGDQLFDASARGRLRQFHDQMMGARQREIRARRDELAAAP